MICGKIKGKSDKLDTGKEAKKEADKQYISGMTGKVW